MSKLGVLYNLRAGPAHCCRSGSGWQCSTDYSLVTTANSWLSVILTSHNQGHSAAHPGGSESNNPPPVWIADCILSLKCKCVSIVICSRAVHGCPNTRTSTRKPGCMHILHHTECTRDNRIVTVRVRVCCHSVSCHPRPRRPLVADTSYAGILGRSLQFRR